jgi:hypothetical protein
MIARLEQWLRWPLWSWRNLTVFTIAVLVLFTAVGRLTTGSGSGPDSRTRNVAATPASTSASATAPTTTPASAMSSAAPASATPTTSAPAAGSATGTNPIISTSSTPALGAGAPTRVALEFATAWTRTTSAQPAWLAGLKPHVTPEYLTALSTVDPARVPATRTLDAGRLVSMSGQQSLVQVATDAGGMTVTLVQRAGQWLVADIEPAAPPPGASTPPLSRATGTAGTG